LKLQKDAIIAREKIADYLLKWRPDNDKSQFLKRAGYSSADWQRLQVDIRKQILPIEAEFLEDTAYGELMRIKGALKGPSGTSIEVVTIWMVEKHTGLTKFITLFPDKER